MPESKNEVVDPVEEMLKKTGCIQHHYQVQVRKKLCYLFNF